MVDGYVRNDTTREELIDALMNALYEFPEQRLGQLLINLGRQEDGSQLGLWDMTDEEWIRLLDKAWRDRGASDD